MNLVIPGKSRSLVDQLSNGYEVTGYFEDAQPFSSITLREQFVGCV